MKKRLHLDSSRSGRHLKPWLAAMGVLAIMGLRPQLATAAVYQVGTGTNNNSTMGITPFGTLWEDNRIQYLYLASELTALGASSGNINSLALNITTVGSPSAKNVNIKVAGVTGYTTITSLQTASFTTVYSNASLTPSSGWNTFTFTAPFFWDGTSNLLVEICRDNPANDWNASSAVQSTQLGAGITRTYGLYDDGAAGCSMTSGNAASANNRRYRPNMRFDIVAAVPCAGTPAAGTVPATMLACPNGSVVISASGTSTDLGISFQWQEWDGANWVNATGGSGATTTTYTTPALTSAMQYRLQTTCANGGATNETAACAVSVGMNPSCFCNGLPTAPTDDETGVTNVTFNTINNSTIGDPAYSDYTAMSTTVEQGNTYTLSVRVNTSGNYNVWTKAWIDWDQNGVFDASEEYDLGIVANVADGLTGLSPLSITVPMGAELGSTYMRVRAAYSDPAPNLAPPTACGDNNWSEAEDYMIQVDPCSGPVPTATASNSGPYCEGDLIELNVATDVGTTFAWTGPGGFTSSVQNPSIPAASLAHAGTYTVVVGTSSGSCTTAGSTSFVVNTYPTGVSATASQASVCAGLTVDLNGAGGVPITPLFQNFDGDLTGWTTQNNSTGGTPSAAAWMLYLSGGSVASPDNSTFIGSNSDAQGSGGTTNTVLFSPEFSLANTTSATLTFNHYFRYISGSTGNVYVSTDAGVNFTLVQSYTSVQGSGLAFAAANIDLSAYAGEPSVMVAFQYLASWGYYWLIDDIQVSAFQLADFSWSSSPAGFTSNEQNPTGVVVNTATTYTLTASNAGCEVTDQVSVAVQAGNSVRVAITTDSNPEEITWEIVDAASNVLVSGGPYTGQSNTTIVEDVCMTDPQGEWYGFKVEDSGNDGITGGGWELRTTDGKLILRDNFDMPFGSSPVVPGNSPTYGAYHSFALPLGAVNIQPDECGIMNNRADNKVYAVKQTGNNYQNSTLNYQFEFSNPDSGRFRRIAKPRNYVIFSEMASLKPLVAGVTYFARVRTDKEGVMTDARWGAGCEMALGSNVACTGLIDDPGHQYYSCNVTRRFRHSSFLVAKPVYGATQYEFRVYQPGEGYDHSFVRNTYTLELNWTAAEAPVLENLSSYQVQVRAKVNNVWGNYCDACPVYINNTPTIPQGSLVQVSGEATLWPNPSRDGQVSLNIDGIAGDVQHITVDVKDIYGQHVYGQEFSNSGDRFNTVLDLPGDIATGIYMVNITVNGEVMTKRLSIVR